MSSLMLYEKNCREECVMADTAAQRDSTYSAKINEFKARGDIIVEDYKFEGTTPYAGTVFCGRIYYYRRKDL